MRKAFVSKLLVDLIDDSVLSRDQSILCVCAGGSEHEVFSDAGFANVTISNLDERMTADSFKPFAWSFEDAQNLTFDDASFDVVFVADGLHHCSSPHRALTEMYRVARSTIVVVESRDNALMRLANKLDLSPEYELEAVIDHRFQYGGVDNKPIPNFIFRWTEREFEKTLNSYDPTGSRQYRYFYDLNLPYQTALFRKSRLKYWVIRLSSPVLHVGLRLFKKQCNTFCMIATKPQRLWPWLAREDRHVVFDQAYARRHFKVDDD